MIAEAKWIESLRGKRNYDPRQSEVEDILKMVTDGNLQHIDGAFITALRAFADGAEEIEYAGCNIRRVDFDHRFEITKDGRISKEYDAAGALITAECSLGLNGVKFWTKAEAGEVAA